MSVVRIDTIAVGTTSGAVFTTMPQAGGEFSNPLPSPLNTLNNVAMWGSNNRLPYEMARDLEATGVLGAGIDAKARITVGKGPKPCRVIGVDKSGNEILEFITEGEIIDWLARSNAFKNFYAAAGDLHGFGQTFFQLLLSRDRSQIVAIKRHDVCECRLSKRDPVTLKSEYVYLSADWDQYMQVDAEDDPHVAKIPLLDMDFPLEDLQSRTEGFVFMLCVQYPLFGRQYYSPSSWMKSKKWVEIAKGIPAMKDAMFNNQMTIKYIVEIHPDFWTSFDPTYDTATAEGKLKIQEDFYDMVDKYLVGGDNAYKSLFSTQVFDKKSNQTISAIKITPVDDKIKDGKLLPDSAAANSEILFAIMLNPAIMGADMPGGPYSGGAGSGSNIREAYLIQVMQVEPERQMLDNGVFGIVKRYNGWETTIVLRFPNQILTTLDTGANTQATA